MQEEKENGEGLNIEVDEYSCLFLSKFKLDRVYCPFQVTCKVSNVDFEPDQKVQVTKVTYSHEKVVLYEVFSKLYPHFYFDYKPPTQMVVTKVG